MPMESAGVQRCSFIGDLQDSNPPESLIDSAFLVRVMPQSTSSLRGLAAQSNALDAFLRSGTGRGLILFALPNCEACVWFAQALEEARVPASMGEVALVEVAEETSESQAVCSRFHVAQFPTLVWCVNGEPYDAWAGFFGDPDPAVRLSALNAELASAADAFQKANA